MRGSDYAELRAFATIAEQGSFARAAAQMQVSPSAVSQTLRGLETRLGVRLLNRTTRSVAPTEAGTRLLERLLPAMAEFDAAIADVKALSGRPSGTLRINCPRTAAIHVLAPLIGPFLKAYPDITLDIVTEEKLVDIVAARFDAGIRLGEKVERDMVAVRFGGDLEMLAVGSPDYFARHGKPKTPRDLKAHRCINTRWPTDGSLYRWEFERGTEELEAAVTGPLIVNEPDVAVRAAVDGVGIAYLFRYQIQAALAAGKLVTVLEEWTPPFPGFYLYYPGRRQMPPPLRAFIDFVAGREVRKRVSRRS
ncbi:MAG TPA: LysR family transcriptional regulator [Dongiaceae bacterium]|jgi:DNA-binding transcriptional LysR family regulator|nr:LysR family transcriptional regulator [Dongiaceae bacterium]